MLDKEIALILEYSEKLKGVKSVATGTNKADFKELLDLLENNIIDCKPIAEELLSNLSSINEAKKSTIHEAPFARLYKAVETIIADEKAEANGIVIVNPINSKPLDVINDWDVEATVEGDQVTTIEGEIDLPLAESGKVEDTNEELPEVITEAFDKAFEVLQGEASGVEGMSTEVQELLETFQQETVSKEDCEKLFSYMLANWDDAVRGVDLDCLLFEVKKHKDSFTAAQAKEIATFTKRHSKTKEVYVYYAEKMIKCAEEAKSKGEKFKFDDFKKNHKSIAAAKDGDITRAEAIILYAERGFSRITTSTRLNFNLNSYDDYKARSYDNYPQWKADKKAGITPANALEVEEQVGEQVETEKDKKIWDLEGRLADTCKRLKIFNEVMATMPEEIRSDFESKVKKELLAEVNKKEQEELQRLQEEIHRKTKAKKHIELIKFGLRSVEEVVSEGEYDENELIHYGLPESYVK